jgi:hypothetical protein
MPVMPTAGNGLFGGFGGDGGIILLFFLFMMCGGFGGGFGGFGADGLYPWMNNSQNINDGFRDQMLNSTVTGIQSGVTSGFGDVQSALCGGFAGVNATINSGFANAESSADARQMANMNQAFSGQMAMSQGFNSVASQLSNCCCENRMATVQTQNIVQAEGAATRLAIQNQTQQILDKMCQQEIDAYKRENEALRTQVTMQNLAASQAAQTAQLIADNTAQTQYLVNRISPYPIPAYTVANPVTPATT